MTTITPTDIKLRLGTSTGPGNSSAAGSAGSSLGGFMSTTDWTTTNLFPSISGTDNANSASDYQVLFVYNSVASSANATGMTNVSVALTNVAGGANVTIGVDPKGAVSYNSATAQSAAPADKNTAPSGVSFSAGPLSVGTIGPLQCIAVWVKRTATDSAAMNGDGFSLEVTYDTTA